MFSLQEYQHVHLLWFKKQSFTLVWKPNPPLRSVRCAHLRARADAPSESTMGARCSRSAYVPLLRCLYSAYACGVKPGSTEALARDQWNLSPATMCCAGSARLWSSADLALAQVRPGQIFFTDMINISIESFKLLLNEINQIENKNFHYNPWRCTSL